MRALGQSVGKWVKAAILPVVLSAVVEFAGHLDAAPPRVAEPGAARATGTVQAGRTKARLTPVQQVSASAVVPAKISSGQLNFTNGAFNLSANVFTVPAGKRLVIEFVSAVAILQSGQLLLTVSIDGLQVLPQFNGNQPDGSSVFAVSQPLRDFVGAGQSVVVAAGRSSNSTVGAMSVNIIGELEDAP